MHNYLILLSALLSAITLANPVPAPEPSAAPEPNPVPGSGFNNLIHVISAYAANGEVNQGPSPTPKNNLAAGLDAGKSSGLSVTAYRDTGCGKDSDGVDYSHLNIEWHYWLNMIYGAQSGGTSTNGDGFQSLLLSRPLEPGEELDVNTRGQDAGFIPNVDGDIMCGQNVEKIQAQPGMALCQTVRLGMCTRLVKYS